MSGEIFLTINGLRLDEPGFCGLLDMTDLLNEASRGSNFTSQGVAGTTFRQKVRDELRGFIQLEVEGYNNSAGAAHSDTGWSGIRQNINEIRDTIVVPSRSALVTASLTYPDDAVWTAQMECPRLDVGLLNNDRTGSTVLAVLEFVIPAGTLVEGVAGTSEAILDGGTF